jgi:hypothetical protein
MWMDMFPKTLLHSPTKLHSLYIRAVLLEYFDSGGQIKGDLAPGPLSDKSAVSPAK